MLPAWVASLIGIPYEAHGRTREGCDCYGIVRLALAEMGKALPPFAFDYDAADRAEEARLIDTGLPLIGAAKIEVPELGDIVLMRFLGITSHVGLYVGGKMILHITKGKASCIEPIDSPLIASRIVGFYRV